MNYIHTSAVKSVSFKPKVTCAVIRSNGVGATGITITGMGILTAFINIFERKEGNSTGEFTIGVNILSSSFVPRSSKANETSELPQEIVNGSTVCLCYYVYVHCYCKYANMCPPHNA